MSYIDAKIIIGILTSFILGGLMYFFGKDTVESLVVGMLSSIFTVLFSIKMDINKSSKLLLSSIKTAKEINSNSVLNELMPSIINNHNKIQRLNNEYLLSESIESLRKCSMTLSRLADQKINAKTEDKRIKILLEVISNTKVKILSVTYPNRWREHLGNRALKENEKIIKDGKKIKRIFILENVTTDTYEIINSHLSIGVECFVAFEQKIPTEVRKHQVIYDNIAVTIPMYEKYGYLSGGTISFDKKDIYQAKDIWDRLELFSCKISNTEDLEALSKTEYNKLLKKGISNP